MRMSGFALMGTLVASAVACTGPTENVGEAEANATDPAALDFSLTVDQFKKVDNSKAEGFQVTGASANPLPCRNRSFGVKSKPSLYDGWDSAKADAFFEDVSGAAFREYVFASCRDDKREVLAWYGKERDFNFNVSEQMIQKDYDPKKLPLLLRLKTIGEDAATHYACNAAPEKKPIKETESATRVELTFACKKTAAPTKKVTGPMDFVSDPGPFVALASFADWLLPSVQSNQASFDKVRKALLATIPEGTYTGAMKTLSNHCEVTLKNEGDVLVVDHVTTSSSRKRHLELTAEDLLGFAEGDLFDFDMPLRVGGPKGGSFVAAEFRDKKGESLNLRFEQNKAPENQVLRIDRSTFCRRLEKK
jgi:hypothetical protein